MRYYEGRWPMAASGNTSDENQHQRGRASNPSDRANETMCEMKQVVQTISFGSMVVAMVVRALSAFDSRPTARRDGFRLSLAELLETGI